MLRIPRHLARLIAEVTVLELRPNCECCDRDLPPDSGDARICSFECTFCALCAEQVLHGRCPNCGGELLPRPRRPAEKLGRYPASQQRVLKSGGCGARGQGSHQDLPPE